MQYELFDSASSQIRAVRGCSVRRSVLSHMAHGTGDLHSSDDISKREKRMIIIYECTFARLRYIAIVER